MNSSFVTIIMAAGKGKRMESDLPKVLHCLGGRPLVHHVIDLARDVGSNRIILIIGYKQEMVRDVTQHLDVELVVQRQQLGTGDAVKSCEHVLEGFSGDVLVLSGDVPLMRPSTVRNARMLHEQSNAAATVFTFKPDDPAGYGRIVRGDNDRLLRIIEQKDANPEEMKIDEVNAGIYFFKKDLMYRALEEVNNENASGEFYLTDTISVLAGWGERLTPFLVDDPVEVAGVNTLQQLSHMEKEFNVRQGK